MAFRLIGQDIAIQTTLGAVANGQTITFSTASSQLAIAKTIHVEEGLEKANVTSLGDGLRHQRAKYSYANVHLKLQVTSAGRQFAGKVGYAMKVENKELSSLSSFTAYVGMITKAEMSEDDDATYEEIDIEVGIEGYTYTTTYA